jgi:hypothetical protein
VQGHAGLSILVPRDPSGLLHVIVDLPAARCFGAVGVIWRAADPDNYWQLMLGEDGWTLTIRQAGATQVLAADTDHAVIAPGLHAIQVVDDGKQISCHLDGALLFGRGFLDERLTAARGVGICGAGGEALPALRQFEAHPREVTLPSLLDIGAPWQRSGTRQVVTELFEGPARDLGGKRSTTGQRTWERIIGAGRIDITGDGTAKVRASATLPNPGRLIYLVDWEHCEFADLQVQITPPGTARGEREHGRCGVVFWQDENNFLLVNDWLNDTYGGASVSCFSCLGGFEDLYDAVWSNVGKMITWGIGHNLRVAFDGRQLLARVNDQPVLYRALTDIYPDAPALMIRKVGLVANWEWGNDTGSRLRAFSASI